MPNNLLKMHLKLLQRMTQKTAVATGELIGNKTTDEITKVSKTSLQSNLEIITNAKVKFM